MHGFTWPQAAVVMTLFICITAVIIMFITAATGGKFPWEK